MPSLLGLIPARGPSPPPDIDNHNVASTRGNGEGRYAVNDLQPVHPLVHPPPTPEANHLPSQTRHQVPTGQRTRHSLHPSDPNSALINRTDLDRDHRKHHKLPSLAIQSCPNTTGGDTLSSPDSKRDRDGDGGYSEVSCLVAGLYTRCSPFVSMGGCTHACVWVYPAQTVFVSFNTLCFPKHPELFTREIRPLAHQWLNKSIYSSKPCLLPKPILIPCDLFLYRSPHRTRSWVMHRRSEHVHPLEAKNATLGVPQAGVPTRIPE